MAIPTFRVGRVTTALVLGQGETSQATVTTVMARARQRSGRRRILLRGAARFGTGATQLIEETVLHLVDQVARHLALRPQAFDLSVVHAGTGLAPDQSLGLGGPSADAAVTMAMLSGITKIPLSDDVAIIGHVASPDGDITPWPDMGMALDAVLRTPDIRTLVCPSLDGDIPNAVLLPEERERAEAAMASARSRLQVVQVSDLAQLLRAVLSDETIVLGSLRSGFFNLGSAPNLIGDPIGDAARVLCEGNNTRFGRCLQAHLFAGRVAEARELLRLRVEHQLRVKQYPKVLGQQLASLIQSVPPSAWTEGSVPALLSADDCLKLSRLIAVDDLEDLSRLVRLTKARAVPVWQRTADETRQPVPADASAALDLIMEQLDAEHLSRETGQAIDEARAAFVMDRVTVGSAEELYSTVAAFYLFVLRRMGLVAGGENPEDVADEAVALLERAFRSSGGVRAAVAECLVPARGGVRHVLDELTEQLKAERQEMRVSRILKTAVDPLDPEARRAFMVALLDRLKPLLPPEMLTGPPERFVAETETILRTVARSLDETRRVFRRL